LISSHFARNAKEPVRLAAGGGIKAEPPRVAQPVMQYLVATVVAPRERVAGRNAVVADDAAEFHAGRRGPVNVDPQQRAAQGIEVLRVAVERRCRRFKQAKKRSSLPGSRAFQAANRSAKS